MNGFSSVWILSRIYKWLNWLNVLPNFQQLNGLFEQQLNQHPRIGKRRIFKLILHHESNSYDSTPGLEKLRFFHEIIMNNENNRSDSTLDWKNKDFLAYFALWEQQLWQHPGLGKMKILSWDHNALWKNETITIMEL